MDKFNKNIEANQSFECNYGKFLKKSVWTALTINSPTPLISSLTHLRSPPISGPHAVATTLSASPIPDFCSPALLRPPFAIHPLFIRNLSPPSPPRDRCFVLRFAGSTPRQKANKAEKEGKEEEERLKLKLN